jgi:hypothetical protein
MSAISFVSILTSLSLRRPIFHSEADFQHEIAWEIRTKHARHLPEIRLEYPLAKVGTIDLWIRLKGYTYAIELKYKKARFQSHVGGEHFSFNKDGAHPLSRYDAFHDIDRVERACALGADCGCAIFLTNDSLYWRREATRGSQSFSLHDGRVIVPGPLTWPPTARKFIEARPSPIHARKQVILEWKLYSQFSALDTEFRYLLYQQGD